MKSGVWLGLLIAGCLSVSIRPQTGSAAPPGTRTSSHLKSSEHRPGPRGLEGWTLYGPIPDDPEGQYPFFLVIARQGHEIRRFEGRSFVWKWMFVADGRQVAYESGPLHFSMSCILADVETGRQLAIYDCFHELPDDAPAWVEALEALR